MTHLKSLISLFALSVMVSGCAIDTSGPVLEEGLADGISACVDEETSLEDALKAFKGKLRESDAMFDAAQIELASTLGNDLNDIEYYLDGDGSVENKSSYDTLDFSCEVTNFTSGLVKHVCSPMFSDPHGELNLEHVFLDMPLSVGQPTQIATFRWGGMLLEHETNLLSYTGENDEFSMVIKRQFIGPKDYSVQSCKIDR